MPSQLSWLNVCQHCKKQKPDTMSRTVKTADYSGPCGHSFCYASCDMSTCKPITATICKDCAEKLAKPTKRAPKKKP